MQHEKSDPDVPDHAEQLFGAEKGERLIAGEESIFGVRLASPRQISTPSHSPSPDEVRSQLQQMRDLLECAWPAILDTARQLFRSVTRVASLAVAVGRDGGDLARTRRLGMARFVGQSRYYGGSRRPASM